MHVRGHGDAWFVCNASWLAGSGNAGKGQVVLMLDVRDHMKTIFAKTGVVSRGELVARLFTEYYEPAATEQAVRIRH